MPLSLTQILGGTSADELKASLVALLTAAGFPASSWQPFSVPRALLEGEAITLADLTNLIASIGGGGLLDDSDGGWLDLIAAQTYQLQRKPGDTTAGQLLLSDAGGIGPQTLLPGAVTVRNGQGGLYRNTAGGQLPLGGQLALPFLAEAPGSAYNVPDGSALALVTSLPGVQVTTATPPGGTWITTQGADPETDDALRRRCRTRWPTLGGGATAAAYQHWALSASAEVTKAAVFPATPAPGQVTLALAGASNPVSGAAVAAVQAYIQQARAPLGIKVVVQPAAVVLVPVIGTLFVQAASAVAAQARALAALLALQATLPIGGTVYLSQLVQLLRDAHPGIVDVQLSQPATAVRVLGAAQIAQFAPTLAWQLV